MTASAERTKTNALDVARKFPTSSLAERVLTAKEGVVIQQLPGLGVAGVVELAEPICLGTPVHVLATVIATGAAAAKLLLVETTDYTIVHSNATSKGELVMVTDQVLNNLLIAYSPDQPEAPLGGQSSIIPTDL